MITGEIKIRNHRIPEQTFLKPWGRGTREAEKENPGRRNSMSEGLKCEEFHRSRGRRRKRDGDRNGWIGNAELRSWTHSAGQGLASQPAACFCT